MTSISRAGYEVVKSPTALAAESSLLRRRYLRTSSARLPDSEHVSKRDESGQQDSSEERLSFAEDLRRCRCEMRPFDRKHVSALFRCPSGQMVYGSQLPEGKAYAR